MSWLTLGNTYIKEQKWAGAVSCFQEALARDPDNLDIRASLGFSYAKDNQHEAAVEQYRLVLDADPTNILIIYRITLSKTYRAPVGEELDQAVKLLSGAGLAESDRALLCFALGKAYDDCGEFDQAFAYYQQANSIEHQHSRYDAQKYSAYIDRIISAFDQDFFHRNQVTGDPSDRPVVVVGVPRSGKSFVEDLLGQNPCVSKAGEVSYFASSALEIDKLSSGSYPEVVRELDRQTASKIASRYLAHLKPHMTKETRRIIDTTPPNAMHLGLIAVLFPNTRVIFSARQPMDVGFCIFAKRFATGNAWASALPDIASHIKAHQRLVNHWKAVLPLEMHSVAYEEIVGDQAGRQKALLEFLELPKGCDSISLEREYYEGRQISDRYIGHWKHYERHLVPLVEDFLL